MRPVLCAVFLIASGLVASAQYAPKVEIFGGLSYANYELFSESSVVGLGSSSTSSYSLTTTNNSRIGLIGWNGAVTANLGPWFGLTSDFSGNYSNSSISNTETETVGCGSNCSENMTTVVTNSRFRIYNFLFGPQFSYPHGRVKPFAHFLLGGRQQSLMETSTTSLTIGASTSIIDSFTGSSAPGNQFAMAFGGGADYPLRKNLSWRVAADYLTNQGTYQNHFRVSTGMVWRPGK